MPVVAGQQYQIATYDVDGQNGTLNLSWNLDSSATADLTLNVNHPPQIYSDGSIHYYIQVSNTGPQTATNVIVSLANFQLNSTFETISSPQCTQSGDTISCVMGNIDAFNSSSPVDIYMKPTSAPQTISHTITTTSDLTDPNTADNQGTYSTDVLAEASPPPPATPVPLPQWALLIMGVLLMMFAIITLRVHKAL